MPATVTLAQLREAAADRADMPAPTTSTFIPTSRWTIYVNSSIRNLYDKLIEAYGEDYFYFATPQAITTDGTNDSYALASDFYKLLGVDLKVNNEWKTVHRFNFSERNRYSLPGIQAQGRGELIRYRLRGTRVLFAPLPSAGQSIRVHYAPTFTDLSADGDTFDGINGWHEWVVNHVALKALAKEDGAGAFQEVSGLLQVEEARIEAIKSARDLGEPSTIRDVYADGRDENFWLGGYP